MDVLPPVSSKPFQLSCVPPRWRKAPLRKLPAPPDTPDRLITILWLP